MYCEKCGNEILQGEKYCSKCGNEVKNSLPNGIKTVSLKCENCNGTLTVDSDKSILACPYCGHQHLIIENDEIILQKIKTSAEKEVELEKIKSAERQHLLQDEKVSKQEETQQVEKFKKSKLSKFLIFAVLLSGLFAYLYFDRGMIWAGILSAIQLACFGISWSMGMKIIPEKKRHMHVLVLLCGLLMVVPIMRACGPINNNGKNDKVEDIGWDIIFLREHIPEPTSKKIKIYINTEDELHIEVHNTSDAQYYEYVAECKKREYSIEVDESIGFEAYNTDGYYIDIIHYDETMNIRVEAPVKAKLIEWEKHTISTVLPQPKSANGVFSTENEEKTVVIIVNMTIEDFLSYCTTCATKGFTIESKSENNVFSAYDDKGHKVEINYNAGNREMTIMLQYPMRFEPIKWPVVGIGTLLPIPNSLSCNVSSNLDWSYSVYIENITRTEYEDYKELCIKTGFDKNIDDYGDSMRAEYSDDIYMYVEYVGFNIMYVSVTGSLNEDYSTYTRNQSFGEILDDLFSVSNTETIPTTTEVKKTDISVEKDMTTAATSNSATTEVSGIDETTNHIVISKYEKAFIRELQDYSLYFMFDEDEKRIIYFGTNDTYIQEGGYAGDFGTGVDIQWDEGWNERLTYVSENAAIYVDVNGSEWEYMPCDLEDAQSVLDSIK